MRKEYVRPYSEINYVKGDKVLVSSYVGVGGNGTDKYDAKDFSFIEDFDEDELDE